MIEFSIIASFLRRLSLRWSALTFARWCSMPWLMSSYSEMGLMLTVLGSICMSWQAYRASLVSDPSELKMMCCI